MFVDLERIYKINYGTLKSIYRSNKQKISCDEEMTGRFLDEALEKMPDLFQNKKRSRGKVEENVRDDKMAFDYKLRPRKLSRSSSDQDASAVADEDL